MEILNVGPLELLLIVLIALVVLGPTEMVRSAYRMGAWVGKFMRSPVWRKMRDGLQELDNLPKQIVRDASMEEDLQKLQAERDRLRRETWGGYDLGSIGRPVPPEASVHPVEQQEKPVEPDVEDDERP